MLSETMAGPLITESRVVPLLLEACPTARTAWDEHLASWKGEAAGGFNDVNVFAHHVVTSYARGVTDECADLFSVVERILADGDEEARSLAALGVLEDVQTISTHHPFGPDAFIRWLGPLSLQAWNQIEAQWRAGGGSLMGVVRLERAQAARMRPKWWQFWKRNERSS